MCIISKNKVDKIFIIENSIESHASKKNLRGETFGICGYQTEENG